MVQVWVRVGPAYVEDLKKRLDALQVSQNALGRAMEPPVDPAQVCRWFTINPKRRLSPSMASVEKIEAAMARLSKGRRIRE